MTESRPTYGPPARYNITCHYHVTRGGQVIHCEFNLTTEAGDAVAAAGRALTHVKDANRAATVTNLQLTVSLDI